MMKRLAIILLCLAALPALAADDPRAQIEALTAALQAAREQRNAAQDQALNLAAQLAALQRRLAEAEEKLQQQGGKAAK